MQMIFLVSFYNRMLQFMEAHILACPSKKYLHIECPGCGLQRSVIALLKGDLLTSFTLYAATVPILAMLLFLLFHLRNKYENGALILRVFYLICVAIIVIQYGYKIATHQFLIYNQ